MTAFVYSFLLQECYQCMKKLSEADPWADDVLILATHEEALELAKKLIHARRAFQQKAQEAGIQYPFSVKEDHRFDILVEQAELIARLKSKSKL